MALFGQRIFAFTFLIFACYIVSTAGRHLHKDKSLVLEGERSPRANPPNVNTDLLEKINVDKYLKNERAVRQQLKCIIKNGPCDAVGKEMKKLMPALAKVQDSSTCDECTPKQLDTIKKVVNHLKTNFPAEWEEGLKKYTA